VTALGIQKQEKEDKLFEEGEEPQAHVMFDFIRTFSFARFFKRNLEKKQEGEKDTTDKIYTPKTAEELSYGLFYNQRGFKTDLCLNTFFVRLTELSSPEVIENSNVFKAVTDYTFKKSSAFAMYMIMFHVLFCMAPHYLQMTQTNLVVIYVCLALQLLMTLFYSLYELSQMLLLGPKTYLMQFMNYMELLMIGLFPYYAWLRLSHPIALLPPDRAASDEMIIANTTLSLLTFFKLFSFFRAVPVMAKMFTLITNVVIDLKFFIFLFSMMVTQSTLMYSMIGVSIYDKKDDFENQTNISPYAMQLINAFRNSIGDITMPKFPSKKSSVLLSYTYLLFVTLQFFMLVILLNFLIAQVSQSYDNVMGKEELYIYLMKAEFNREYLAFMKLMGWLKESVESPLLYIRAPREMSDVDDQYAGYVKTVKNAINKTQKALKTEIASVVTSITDVNSNIADIKRDNASVNSNIADIKRDNASVKTDIASVKTDIASVKSSIMADIKRDNASVKTDIANIKSSIMADNSKMYAEMEEIKSMIHDIVGVMKPK